MMTENVTYSSFNFRANEDQHIVNTLNNLWYMVCSCASILNN